ncbi:MAG: glycosyltransferase [Lachnospiraceae bacterium]|nr:glycosyltransferase [Lachnospiraceae bacterium]
MKKDKILFVVQRYGMEVNGGAEYHCRVLAEHLLERYEVAVFTSCARDYMPWDNFYPVGMSKLNNVAVHRFPVEKTKDEAYVRELSAKVNRGEKGAETEWIEEVGPFCPKLIAALKSEGTLYKAIIFFGYAFYPTVVGLQSGLKHTILIPTAHDESNIYKEMCYRTLQSASAFLYNSVEERQFLFDRFGTGNKPGRLTCVGIELPDVSNGKLPERDIQDQDYVVYVGRVSHGKNFMQLNRYFIQYKRSHNTNLKLLVVGRVDNEEKLAYHEDIVYMGYVSEEDKTLLMKNAALLIMPSKYESLSLVILESMALGRPVLVNGDCEVLKGQCIRSNAGLYYSSYAEFEKALDYMLTDSNAYTQMAENGLEFVRNNYSWQYVVENVSSLIEEIGRNREGEQLV